MSKNKQLDNRERVFVDEYLKDLDARRAAKKAGYSDTMARTKAYGWVSNSVTNTKPHVFEAIRAKMKKNAEKAEITQQDVLQMYLRLAKFDTRKLYHEDGRPKRPHELDDETALAISGVECGDSGYKFKASDKKAVADSLARHLGMFDDKLNITGSMNVTILDDVDD